MRVYVVDASVAARFLLVEELSDKAELLLESFRDGAVELRSPELVKYEVGNTLWKAAKQRLMNANEASERFSCFLRLRLGSIELNDQECKEALAWGATTQHTTTACT